MKYALWFVQAVLALAFVFSGVMKLILPPEALTAAFPLPVLFVRFIGVCEVLGAVGLILPGLLRIRPVLTPLAAALIQMSISRSREYEADAGGARMLGTGEPLARALEKIEVYAKRIPMQKVSPAQENAFIINPFQPEAQLQGPPPRGGTRQRQRTKSLGDYFRTHPPTEDRIARLRAMQF